ncbi:Thaumatin-like protein 1 [Bienertia sinuspersici]
MVGTSTGSGPALASSGCGFILESVATFILLAHLGGLVVFGAAQVAPKIPTLKSLFALPLTDTVHQDKYLAIGPGSDKWPCRHCNSTGCPVDVNKSCPEELQQKNSHSGDVEACKTACLSQNFAAPGSIARQQNTLKYSRDFVHRLIVMLMTTRLVLLHVLMDQPIMQSPFALSLRCISITTIVCMRNNIQRKQ